IAVKPFRWTEGERARKRRNCDRRGRLSAFNGKKARQPRYGTRTRGARHSNKWIDSCKLRIRPYLSISMEKEPRRCGTEEKAATEGGTSEGRGSRFREIGVKTSEGEHTGEEEKYSRDRRGQVQRQGGRISRYRSG
ncbi:hypothetical protein X777_11615, partial [Ooceraea biroi]